VNARIGWPLALVFALAAPTVLIGLLQTLPWQWSFTKSVEVDNSTYFRLRLDFAYKGEPKSFDVVYGCNVRRTRYKDGSSSVEGGMVPALYGRRMGDGQLVAVRTVDGCREGTTASGRIPKDVLPLMIVYPKADDPSFGIGYISSDAYDSPLSQLTFGSAVIETAAREDYLAFRKRADNDLARPRPGTKDIIEDALTMQEAQWAGSPIGNLCSAAIRVRVPDELREVVRGEWPAHKPRYWGSVPSPEDQVAQKDNSVGRQVWNYLYSRKALAISDRVTDPPTSLPNLFFGDSAVNFGMPSRSSSKIGGLIPTFPGAYYPLGSENTLSAWLTGERKPSWRFDSGPEAGRAIDVRDGLTRGFAYCVPSGTKPLPVKIDGQTVAPGGWWTVFERDDYAYFFIDTIDAGAYGGRM
jgi:hypothetical protein